MYFGIQEGPFSGKLNVGLLNKARTEFLAGEDIIDPDDGELAPGMEDYLSGLHHEDCTNMAIRVVADHILQHYNGKLGIGYTDGVTYEIRINKTTAASPNQPQPAASAGQSAESELDEKIDRATSREAIDLGEHDPR